MTAAEVTFATGADLAAASPGDIVDVLVRVAPPKAAARTPVNISCVLDVSGSMGTEATIQSASGATESHGLSLLDVAKHGVKTVVTSLDENDNFSLITFNNTGRVVMGLTPMTKENKEKAFKELDDIHSGGGTDIWEGLVMGLDSLKDGTTGATNLGHIICLSDGETQNKTSVLPFLEEYKRKFSGEAMRLPATVSTVGFGYGVDSTLLVDMARACMGSYAFIPDAGFVGTIFVNLMAQFCVTCAVQASLTVQTEGGMEPLEADAAYGEIDSMLSGETFKVKLGTLQTGQSKDIALKMKVKSAMKAGDSFAVATLEYEQPGGHTVTTDCATGEVCTPLKAEYKLAVAEQVSRCKFVTTLRTVTEKLVADMSDSNLAQQSELIVALATELEEVQKSVGESEYLKALSEDVSGQAAEAVSKMEFYRKWGRHYMPSVMFAHALQVCNNFKDPGVQLYGGDLFKDIQGKADDAFNDLPAPKPSRPAARASVSSGSSAPVAMSSYNDRYGG
eukprot:TRINITY_DN210_c0_g2_i1.p1 TRINITY_DN210_c0_g2~~TRINITY_DN210_c0_g2_i1.p1  ORF type:complete len:506 (-),score=109.03 TRINITY_DN210_c0_g2_i1:140-1657(-)